MLTWRRIDDSERKQGVRHSRSSTTNGTIPQIDWGSLERDHPGAAASIREGLEETLTVQRLGLTGSLERTLRTTNIIENLMGSV